MDIFNDSFAALMADFDSESEKADAKEMRNAADRGSIAADKVQVCGFGYTIGGGEFVKSGETPTVTDFEGKNNLFCINDRIGECGFARALVFTRRFARRLRQRFEGIVFDVALSVKEDKYFLSFARWRPYEGHFYGGEEDIRKMENPFGAVLGCVKLKFIRSDDCLKILAFDEEGQQMNIPEDIFPASTRGELVMIPPEESAGGKAEAKYSYACCGDMCREVMSEEIPELARFAENLGYHVR